MKKSTWGMAATAAVLAVVIGAGVVMAQSPDDGTGIAFLDRVAEKLGVDRPQLEQAIEDARSEELDEAVANGDLTQEQADALKERLDELPADAPFLGPGFGHKFGGEGFAFSFKFGFDGRGARFASDELAAFLGIDEAQLGEELQADGATLVTVAEAHGKSRDELKAFIAGEFKTKLDEAVASGDLTRVRADEIAANFDERIGDLIDNELGGRPLGGRGFKGEFGFAVPFGGLHHGVGFVIEDIAGFLGIERDQLFEELSADGATLATVAEAHGKSRDELKAFITGELKARLDEAVADGDLTQERADEILSDSNERLDKLIDAPHPSFDGRFRGGPFPFEGEMFEEGMEIDPSDGTQGGELLPVSRS